MHQKFVILMALLVASLPACSKKPVTPGLISTAAMGTLRAFHFSRVITHFHTPYSFDACDGKGLDGNNQPNLTCLHDIKYALCYNHINTTFISDHSEHFSETSFTDLLLTESGDTTLVNGSGDPVANQLHCPDGFSAVMAPGLEGQLLGLGMEKHADPVLATRQAIYGGNTAVEKGQLQTLSNALVAIPHTESRDLATLQAIAPDAIEIYNIHANLDPKIRKKYLNMPPFQHIAQFLNYVLDPFNDLNADYIFMEFLEFSPVYMEKWNALVSAGSHVTGIGGCDSHENIFSQKASDGERLDAHRRMTRFMTNLVLTTADDTNSLKNAIKAGQVFFTIEGLGTPIGLDFHGNVDAAIVEMGGTMNVTGATTTSITFKIPHVHPDFPGMDGDAQPEISADLHYIDNSGNDSVVARAKGADQTLTYASPANGNYRVHVYMYPRHLKDLAFDPDLAGNPYQWIVSNNIRVAP